MNPASLGIAALIGMLLPLQALINAALGRQTFGAIFAALVSFAVGTGVLLLWWGATRPNFDIATLMRVPWWAWTGGAIGAVYVTAAILLIPRTGAASLICLIVFGQLAGSLLLDHFGVLHVRQPIDGMRIAGVVLVIVGALLVVRPWQSHAG